MLLHDLIDESHLLVHVVEGLDLAVVELSFEVLLHHWLLGHLVLEHFVLVLALILECSLEVHHLTHDLSLGDETEDANDAGEDEEANGLLESATDPAVLLAHPAGALSNAGCHEDEKPHKEREESSTCNQT